MRLEDCSLLTWGEALCWHRPYFRLERKAWPGTPPLGLSEALYLCSHVPKAAAPPSSFLPWGRNHKSPQSLRKQSWRFCAGMCCVELPPSGCTQQAASYKCGAQTHCAGLAPDEDGHQQAFGPTLWTDRELIELGEGLPDSILGACLPPYYNLSPLSAGIGTSLFWHYWSIAPAWQ